MYSEKPLKFMGERKRQIKLTLKSHKYG